MNQIKRNTIFLIFVLCVLGGAYASVTYRVISSGPNNSRAAIDIKEKSLFWSLVLRYNNTVKLKVINGGTLISSSPEGRIFIINGTPVTSAPGLSVIFEAKFDKKKNAKLLSATYNGRPVKIN